MATQHEIIYPQPAPIRGMDVSRPENQLNPLFSPDLNNNETVDGVLQKRRGYVQLLAGFPDAKPVMEGFQYGDAAGVLHQVFATTTKFVEYNSVDTWSDRSGAVSMTGTIANPVFMTNVGGLSTDALFVSNGVDPIKKWTGTGNWANITLTGPTTLTARCMAGFKGHLVLGDVTDDGTKHVYRIKWSNQGDPENYSGVSSGFLNLIEDDENTKVMCLHPLKLALIAYKNKSIYNLEYRGGSGGIYFAADQVIANSGVISPKAVAPIGDLDVHFIVTTDNVQLFDGFNFVRPALGDRIKKNLFANLNWGHREKIFAKAFPEYYTVAFIYPSGASTVPDKGFMWNWLEDSWHPFTLADAGYSLIYSDIFFSARKALYGIGSNVMTLFSGNSDAGTNINGYFRTKLSDYSDLEATLRYTRKVVRRVDLDHAGTAPSIEVGVANGILDTPSLATAQTLADDPTGIARVTTQKSGRYHTVKVSDNSANTAYKVAGIITYSSRGSGR
jgi:hypothetical protein